MPFTKDRMEGKKNTKSASRVNYDFFLFSCCNKFYFCENLYRYHDQVVYESSTSSVHEKKYVHLSYKI